MTDFAIDQLTRLSKAQNRLPVLIVGDSHDPWVPENVPPEYLENFADAHIRSASELPRKDDPYADMWARFKRNERKSAYRLDARIPRHGRELDPMSEKLPCLTSLGLDENTIFIFTSDHGEMFGAQGRRAKNIFYEEAVKVPFLMKWGSRLPKGRADFCFNTVDIMPSLLTLMGLSYPVEVEGLDLSKCLSGEADNEKGSLLMGTGPTAIFGNGYEWRAVRDKRYTYAVYLRDRMSSYSTAPTTRTK
jgi:arylsulfatase A-like enzyme